MNTTAQVKCPACWSPILISAESCACGYTLPAHFWDRCVEAPPLPIIAAGFSGSGKTHLLLGLSLTLCERLGMYLAGGTYEIASASTDEMLRLWHASRARKRLLPATAPGAPEILLLRGAGFPNQPERTLIIYDVAGESIERYRGPQGDTTTLADLKALADTTTIWFVASPRDLQLDNDLAGDDQSGHQRRPLGLQFRTLVDSYGLAMDSLHTSTKDRTALVVYTKGDCGDFPSEVHDYLAQDPFNGPRPADRNSFNFDEYVQRMEAISTILRDYTIENVPGGAAFVDVVERRGMRLKFCITSALGQSPDTDYEGQYTHEPWEHQRVLDPLIWTLQGLAAAEQHVVLLLDAAADGEPVYSSGIAGELYQELSSSYHVQQRFLGRLRAESDHASGQLATRPAHARLRLIGPHLDNLPEDTRVVVLTNGVIHDLADYRGTVWNRRLVLASMTKNDEVLEQWPTERRCVLDGETTARRVLDAFHSLPKE